MKKKIPYGLILSIAIPVALISLIAFDNGDSIRASNQISELQGGGHGGVNPNGNSLAPDLELETLDGGTISLAEFRGKKPVILDFWASWCPNCRRDMPKLNRWYEEYKDQIEVIGINLQEPKSTVQRYIDSANITFPIALDKGGQASRLFGIQYTNTHFLIDIDGNLVSYIPGDISEAQVKSILPSLEQET